MLRIQTAELCSSLVGYIDTIVLGNLLLLYSGYKIAGFYGISARVFAGFRPRRSGFDRWLAHLGFMVEKVVFEQIFLVFIPPIHIFLTLLIPLTSFVCPRHYMILTVDSVFK